MRKSDCRVDQTRAHVPRDTLTHSSPSVPIVLFNLSLDIYQAGDGRFYQLNVQCSRVWSCFGRRGDTGIASRHHKRLFMSTLFTKQTRVASIPKV